MLRVTNLKKSFGEKEIFTNISFVLNPMEKVGIIGKNGCGKTTLFKIIIGEIEPDEGEVIIDKNEIICYLPQTLEVDFKKTIKEFFSEKTKIEDWLIRKYLGKIGIDNINIERNLKSFSAGEITKIALARIIMQNPTILLLDEPTNHLDLEGIVHLQDFLSHFKGGVLLTSHDRYILDGIAKKIIDFQLTEKGRITKIYPGNFSSYKEIRKKEIENQEIFYQVQQKKIEKLKKDIERLKVKARKMNRLPLKKKKDGYLFSSKGAKLDRRAKSEEKRIQRLLESNEKIEKPQKEKGFNFYFGGFLKKDQRALKVENLSFSFGKENILSNINLEIYGKERVAFLGPNGSGKTILIKSLLGEIKPESGVIKFSPGLKIGYLPQEIIFSDHQKTVLEEFEKDLEMSENETRRILGQFLFSGNEQVKKIKDLSSGERRRLYLAKIFASKANFLLLDEPTNHLDIPSIEAVESALSQFEGAFLVTSHDRYFLKNIFVKKIYYLKRGEIKEIYSF